MKGRVVAILILVLGISSVPLSMAIRPALYKDTQTGDKKQLEVVRCIRDKETKEIIGCQTFKELTDSSLQKMGRPQWKWRQFNRKKKQKGMVARLWNKEPSTMHIQGPVITTSTQDIPKEIEVKKSETEEVVLPISEIPAELKEGH